MWVLLLSIIGSYALSVAFLHWLHSMGKLPAVPSAHILLMTCNNEQNIEWVLRSLFIKSQLHGKSIRTTIVDKHSTDDTLRIIERLSQRHPLEIHRFSSNTPLEEVIQQYPEQTQVYRVNNQK